MFSIGNYFDEWKIFLQIRQFFTVKILCYTVSAIFCGPHNQLKSPKWWLGSSQSEKLVMGIKLVISRTLTSSQQPLCSKFQQLESP